MTDSNPTSPSTSLALVKTDTTPNYFTGPGRIRSSLDDHRDALQFDIDATAAFVRRFRATVRVEYKNGTSRQRVFVTYSRRLTRAAFSNIVMKKVWTHLCRSVSLVSIDDHLVPRHTVGRFVGRR